MSSSQPPVLDAYALAVIVVSATFLALGFLTAKRRAERKVVVRALSPGASAPRA